MIDMGLSSGVKALWKDDLLCDYTIKVEHREFKVHKVVLAAVSDYFHAMLTGSMQESQTDHVELKGLSAEAVSDLIELIYTGDENTVNENAADILQCALYLQIPAAVDICKKRLLRIMNDKNCLHILSAFLSCSLKDEADQVKKFVQANWKLAFKHCNTAEISLEILQFLIEGWRGSELDLFVLIKDWVMLEYEDRKQYLNNLMSLVRFCLMTPQETAAVKEMDVYLESDDSWRELVDNALVYHNLPEHQKVLDESEQSRVRSGPSPFVYSDDSFEGEKMFCAADEHYGWRTHLYEGGKTYLPFTVLIVVNNFLIAYTGADNNKWCMFNPRTLKWSEIASMPRPKCAFGLVFTDKHLYALGGVFGNKFKHDALANEMEHYSFQNNTWSVTGRMPVGVTRSSACVFGNHIYSSGGVKVASDREYTLSKELHCFNLCTQEWESKAPMLRPKVSHKMGVMKIGNEDVIVTFEEKNLNIEMYSPATDAWSKFEIPKLCTRDFYRGVFEKSMKILHGNSIFFLKVMAPHSLRWTLAESGEKPSEVLFGNVPVPDLWEYSDFQAVLLAVPSHVFQQSSSL